MRVFAIGDLHLSGFSPKPMNIFGEHWSGHWDNVKESWSELAADDDIVLLPGDLSWAMKLIEAKVDIDAVCAMPGKKVLIKGNHDYWWSSLGQVEAMLTNHTYIIQNNSITFGDYVFAGSRGWTCPGYNGFDEAVDKKLYLREAGRLEMSLKHAKKTAPDKELVCMIHFPPTDAKGTNTLFTDLFEKYGATKVVYGHLHSVNGNNVLEGNLRRVEYSLVSCDYTDFKLVQII